MFLRGEGYVDGDERADGGDNRPQNSCGFGGAVMANRPSWMVTNQRRQLGQRRMFMEDRDEWQSFNTPVRELVDIPGTRAYSESSKPTKER